MKPIRILVADDHAVVRQGLRHIFAMSPDIAIAAEAVDGRDVLEKLGSTAVDVLLMDVSMPATDAVELVKRVRSDHPGVAVLVHSMHADAPIASRMLKAGAAGYITKDSEPEQLTGALRKVAGGGRYIGAELAERLEFGGAEGPHAGAAVHVDSFGHGPQNLLVPYGRHALEVPVDDADGLGTIEGGAVDISLGDRR